MIALEQARQYMESLGLTAAVEVLDSRLDAAATKQMPYPGMLADLLGVEVAARRERYLTTRTRMAHLPFRRTLEQFGFAFQPSIDERQVKELAALAFVSEATNLLLLGPPGVGKTHLAVALALRSIENGYGAYFVRAYDLMEDLRKARAEHRLDRRMRVYLAPKVLIAGEFGIWPYDRDSATAFFSLVSARYERGSIILTSNKGFAEWGGAPRRHRDRHRHPRPAAAPQPRPQHPGRKLQAQGKTTGWSVDLTPAVQSIVGGNPKHQITARGGSILIRR